MSIKTFVNSYDQYTEFLSFLDKKIEEVRVSLESAQSIESVYRLQGQLFALRRLKKLKEEVNGPN